MPKFAFISCFLWCSLVTYGVDKKLTPKAIDPVKVLLKGYEACRKQALDLVEKEAISADRLKYKLNNCRESHPAASIYADCEKQSMKGDKGSGNKKEDKLAIKQCRKQLAAMTFSPDNPTPFSIVKNRFFFAGLGMNAPIEVANLAPPSFECKKVNEVIQAPKSAEYFLFGNHPHWFGHFNQLSITSLTKVLGLEKVTAANGSVIEDLGKFYGPLQSKQAVVYFPMASCAYSGNLGKYFSGLSAYYLLDFQGKAVYPYFGIAFYKKRGYLPSYKEIKVRLLSLLNEKSSQQYSSYSKNGTTEFLASNPISEWDSEGDPRNVCQTPRRHTFISAVKPRKENSTYPDYAIVANIDNLCRFGDLLSKRFK